MGDQVLHARTPTEVHALLVADQTLRIAMADATAHDPAARNAG